MSRKLDRKLTGQGSPSSPLWICSWINSQNGRTDRSCTTLYTALQTRNFLFFFFFFFPFDIFNRYIQISLTDRPTWFLNDGIIQTNSGGKDHKVRNPLGCGDNQFNSDWTFGRLWYQRFWTRICSSIKRNALFILLSNHFLTVNRQIVAKFILNSAQFLFGFFDSFSKRFLGSWFGDPLANRSMLATAFRHKRTGPISSKSGF